MKTDKHGCSTCEPGAEQFEEFTFNGKSYVQYDFRSQDGELFSTVAPSLEIARKRKDHWILKRIIAPDDTVDPFERM